MTVTRISLPTPFSVGRVNCYLFSGDQLTLLDPGPAYEQSYPELVAGLDRAGYGIADVERILITHQHIDHYGVADRIRAESGAEVLAHKYAVDRLEDPLSYSERERAFFTPFLESMGVPASTAQAVTGLPEPYAEFQAAVTVDRTLREGDHVTVGDGRTLDVVHTPGHSPDGICFHDPAAGEVFTGDHVLAEITPNPLLTLAPEGNGDPDAGPERTRSLPDYVASLQKLESLDANLGYGGHRDPIPDLQGRIAETIAHHDRRKARIADILAEEGPLTAYEVMGRLFPDLPMTETFAGMSETVGHLDLLEDDGRVTVSDFETDCGTRHYVAT